MGISGSNDVIKSHWAAPILKTAMDKGWYDYDENPPTGEMYDQPIKRQLAVKIVMKAMAKSVQYDYNVESAKIKDFSNLNGRYYDTTLSAYADGILTGDLSGMFRPEGSLTRAEACTIIKKAMDKYVGNVSIEPQPEQTTVQAVSGGVSENGQLKVVGTQLCNEKGEAVVLKGMSSHGLQWFPQFVSNDYIKAVVVRGANVMRFAMYTGENGYISNHSVKNTLTTAVDNAVANDMYAIIDWHILSDGNPMTYKNEAKEFFAEMAQKYKNSKAVIYEICNEPNGNISWSKDVKPYAEEIINTIRTYDSNAIILVGNPQWDQDLDSVVADRLSGNNIMYTCHFYAGTHTQWLRDKITNALNNGIPIFVSEWGTSSADGNGGVFTDETNRWLNYMADKKISWCNWSLCDKNETSAALNQGANASDGLSNSELSDSGKIVFNSFK
ncbi:MAG: cellulase family glycosylhydrolase [Eubacterium sp.]|nr:cellulase family glycosylhydrolase [Eubacterium sp.]